MNPKLKNLIKKLMVPDGDILIFIPIEWGQKEYEHFSKPLHFYAVKQSVGGYFEFPNGGGIMDYIAVITNNVKMLAILKQKMYASNEVFVALPE